MVLSFSFPGGDQSGVRFKSKFVRTKGFKEEQVRRAAGLTLFDRV